MSAVIIILSVVFLGPIGLIIMYFYKKEWWNKCLILAPCLAWSVLYTIAAISGVVEGNSASGHDTPDIIAPPESLPETEPEEPKKDTPEESIQGPEEISEPKPDSSQDVLPYAVRESPSYTKQPDTDTSSTNERNNYSSTFPNKTYAAPDGECKIKGNVNSKGEKIYHMPGGAYYDRTDVKPEEGDKIFCTEEEAVSAGFRASKR